MEIYTEQEAAAKLQRIAQILTDGTIAARKLSQPLDAALRPKVLTEALQPFEAATITGTAGGVSIYGAAKLQPVFGTPSEYAILKEYGATWRRALIDFVKAWRDLLQAKAVNPQTVEALKQLEYGVEDCIVGVKEWIDENGWPTGESAPRKYFTLLQQFKIQVADILDNQQQAESATNWISGEDMDQINNRTTATIEFLDAYINSNPPGAKPVGILTVLESLFKSEDGKLYKALRETKGGFLWDDDINKLKERAKKRLIGIKKQPGYILKFKQLRWPDPGKIEEKIKQYRAIASKRNPQNKNKPNKTEGKNA